MAKHPLQDGQSSHNIGQVTYLEPERLALKLQDLMERRATLRAILSDKLKSVLTAEEQADIEGVISLIDREVAELERQLADLRRFGGPDGSGQ